MRFPCGGSRPPQYLTERCGGSLNGRGNAVSDPTLKGNDSLATTALCSLMTRDTFFIVLSLIWTTIAVAALLYVLFA